MAKIIFGTEVVVVKGNVAVIDLIRTGRIPMGSTIGLPSAVKLCNRDYVVQGQTDDLYIGYLADEIIDVEYESGSSLFSSKVMSTSHILSFIDAGTRTGLFDEGSNLVVRGKGIEAGKYRVSQWTPIKVDSIEYDVDIKGTVIDVLMEIGLEDYDEIRSSVNLDGATVIGDLPNAEIPEIEIVAGSKHNSLVDECSTCEERYTCKDSTIKKVDSNGLITVKFVFPGASPMEASSHSTDYAELISKTPILPNDGYTYKINNVGYPSIATMPDAKNGDVVIISSRIVGGADATMVNIIFGGGDTSTYHISKPTTIFEVLESCDLAEKIFDSSVTEKTLRLNGVISNRETVLENDGKMKLILVNMKVNGGQENS